MLESLNDAHPWVLREAERLESGRWLAPDGTLEALTNEALAGLQERCEAEAGGRAQRVREARGLEAELVTFRTLHEALAEWSRRWAVTNQTHPARLAGLQALDSFQREMVRAFEPGGPREAFASAVEALAVRVAGAPGDWPSPFREAWNASPPLLPAVRLHLRWTLHYGENSGAQSPWGPVVALWALGVAPLALPLGGLVCWVPRLRAGVPDLGAEAPNRYETLGFHRILADLVRSSPGGLATQPAGTLVHNPARPSGTVAPPERVNIVYKPMVAGMQEERELTLRVLVTGDFTHRPDPTFLEDRRVRNVDRDNFQEVLAHHKPTLELDVADTLGTAASSTRRVSLTFQRMTDFDPEGIVAQVPELRALMETRAGLLRLRSLLGNVPKVRRRLTELLRPRRPVGG